MYLGLYLCMWIQKIVLVRDENTSLKNIKYLPYIGIKKKKKKKREKLRKSSEKKLKKGKRNYINELLGGLRYTL